MKNSFCYDDDGKQHSNSNRTRRHYGTIGIEDVFLNNNNNASTTADEEDNNDNNNCVMMVGKIKSTPEDFIVREISLNGIIADINLTSQIMTTSDDKKSYDNESKTKEVLPSLQEDVNDTDTADHKDNTTAASKCLQTIEKEKEEPEREPIEQLKEILRKYVVGDAQHILQSIQDLNKVALHRLEQQSSHHTNDTNESSCYEDVKFELNTNDKICKSQFHELMRDVFPLLYASGTNKTFINVTIDDRFFGLAFKLYAPTEDLPKLYQFLKHGFEYNTNNNNKSNQQTMKSSKFKNNHKTRGNLVSSDGPILRLKPDLPRNERRPIHQEISNRTKGMLETVTINNYINNKEEEKDNITTSAIQVHWTKIAERKIINKKRKRDNNNEQENNYCLCVIKKRQREHLNMIHTISEKIRYRISDISVAGIKDMYAITYQFCTLYDFNNKKNCIIKIQHASKFLNEAGIEVVPLYYVNQPLKRGDLIGNRFELIMRNIRRVDVIQEENGFNDVFYPISTKQLDNAIARVKEYGFINFYGEQRVGEPGLTELVGVRPFDVGKVLLQENYTKAIDLIMTGRRMINGNEKDDYVDDFRYTWKITNGDPIETYKKLPSSKNSVPRERTILKGLKRYGTDNPKEAFKCLPRHEYMFYLNAYQSFVWNTAASERIRRYGNRVIKGDLVLTGDDNNNSDSITVVDDELLTNDISLDNVVLPLPGYGVKYPDNDIGNIYNNLLEKDGIKFEKKKTSKEDSPIKGDYRRLVCHATNISHEYQKDDEDSMNWKLNFDLPKGSYATMFLRELMRTTVARETE